MLRTRTFSLEIILDFAYEATILLHSKIVTPVSSPEYKSLKVVTEGIEKFEKFNFFYL